MSIFMHALSRTLHHEGGFVDNPHDPGGATFRGISLRFLNSAGYDVDNDGDVDIDDIHALVDNPEAINGLYQSYFWIPNRLGEIPSELLAVKIFDMCVNMGGRQAWKIVQRASGRLKDDGIVGPKTITYVVQQAEQDYELVTKIRVEQAKFYINLIKAKPQLGAFKLGWLRRAAQ